MQKNSYKIKGCRYHRERELPKCLKGIHLSICRRHNPTVDSVEDTKWRMQNGGRLQRVKYHNFTKNFLVWKFCRAQFERHSFSICGNCAFPQNFHTRKLGEIRIFYAVLLTKQSTNTQYFNSILAANFHQLQGLHLSCLGYQ